MGKEKCPTWNWRKKSSPSFPMRDMLETFAPSHIPFFLGHDPGISSSWDLEQTGGLQSDFQIPQVARCFTFIFVIQKPMIPAISMLLELLSNFSHSKRLHLAPSGLRDEAITAKFGMKPSTCWRIPGYLNFRVDCFAITRLRRSPNWATPTQIPWPTLQATFHCRQPWFFLLAVSWAEAGRFTSWEESGPKKVTYKANSSTLLQANSYKFPC